MIFIFTGLIQEKGEIIAINGSKTGKKIRIKAKEILENIKMGDSIATNGVCLTVTSFSKNYFEADIMNETIERSTFKKSKVGEIVNLEKSLRLTDFLGGHLVYGDVDCEGIIESINSVGIAKIFRIKIPKVYTKYIIEKGRITVDGASLTVISVGDNYFEMSLIPHTLEYITLGKKSTGDNVNIETDMLAKYMEKLMVSKLKEDKNTNKVKSKITKEFIRKYGF